MRNVFVEKLDQAMAKDKKIMVLTADLGYKVFEEIQKKYPEQFINTGVGEANMVGVAAGLAMNGYHVFIYSIVPFVTSRIYEQIKLSLCYDDLQVKIIGVGGGFSYGAQGVSHHSMEDVPAMRALPNMAIVCPADKQEAEALMDQVIDYKSPLFLRLGKHFDTIDRQNYKLKFGEASIIKEKGEVALLSTGNILNLTLKVAEELKESDINARIISLPFIKPLDNELILKIAREVKGVFTIEENSIIGGLGSGVADLLAENSIDIKFKKFGLPDEFIKDVGSHNYLRARAGLTLEVISKEIMKLIK